MMAYTETDYPTKTAMKAAVKRGDEVRVFNPGLGGAIADGPKGIEGPHYPKPHSWYALVMVKDGAITRVIS